MFNQNIFFKLYLILFTFFLQAEYGEYGIQGKRPTMEDACCVNELDVYSFYGLFDGHGGDKVSNFVSKNLLKNIKSDNWNLDIKNAIANGFAKTDEQLGDYAKSQGSTAVTAFIKDKKIITAHVGDSRAVLCRGEIAVPLTVDHKPNRSDEKERIENLGGFIMFFGCWRVQGSLAVSRALGDKQLRPYVISVPEINEFEILPEDQFLILACDGVWDVLTDQEAADIVNNSLSNNKDFNLAAQSLVEAAYNAGSTDNISAVIISLR